MTEPRLIHAPEDWRNLQATIAQQQARITELERERDDYKAQAEKLEADYIALRKELTKVKRV